MGILSTLPRPKARKRQYFNSDQLMSILMVALASSVEMTWRGPMDSFYLGQEGSEINNLWRDQGRPPLIVSLLPSGRCLQQPWRLVLCAWLLHAALLPSGRCLQQPWPLVLCAWLLHAALQPLLAAPLSLLLWLLAAAPVAAVATGCSLPWLIMAATCNLQRLLSCTALAKLLQHLLPDFSLQI
ncbi:hypothetical protein Acr_21g0004820 [Actinidia rufa]|uniref:Uncharacterized protein n=1 Tax=Actinidia rufa TaxID=165716 RepID=A0A7J0GGD4_9ERIC|nr:hypothetical protein Acr_21g0004820 [Actinidia rufa]